MTVTSKKEICMLCNQIHKTTNQLQKGIRGKSRNRNLNGRKQQSGALARSGKTKKRAVKRTTDEATVTADALANVDRKTNDRWYRYCCT